MTCGYSEYCHFIVVFRTENTQLTQRLLVGPRRKWFNSVNRISYETTCDCNGRKPELTQSKYMRCYQVATDWQFSLKTN